MYYVFVFVKNQFIKPESVERREYQINIAESASKKNTLVVLPTGLGKTLIALFLIASELKKKDSKILFLAPTKPLVLQHANFLKDFLTIESESIIVFTGEVSDGQMCRQLDVTRAKQLLNFEAKTSLLTGLVKTITWYEGNYDD